MWLQYNGTRLVLKSLQLYIGITVLTRRIWYLNPKQSKASSDHFLYSHDLDAGFSVDIVKRNYMLDTVGVKELNV